MKADKLRDSILVELGPLSRLPGAVMLDLWVVFTDPKNDWVHRTQGQWFLLPHELKKIKLKIPATARVVTARVNGGVTVADPKDKDEEAFKSFLARESGADLSRAKVCLEQTRALTLYTVIRNWPVKSGRRAA